MKKIVLILGILAFAGTLPSSTASAGVPLGFPWNSPIIKGDPKLNRDIKRPGPYTPKPKPKPTSASVMPGGCCTLPQCDKDSIIELGQGGKKSDSQMF